MGQLPTIAGPHVWVFEGREQSRQGLGVGQQGILGHQHHPFIGPSSVHFFHHVLKSKLPGAAMIKVVSLDLQDFKTCGQGHWDRVVDRA